MSGRNGRVGSCIVLVLVAAAVGCAGLRGEEDEDETEAAAGAQTVARRPSLPTCNGQWKTMAALAPWEPEELDVVLEPSSAMQLVSLSRGETFSATVDSPDGKSRKYRSRPDDPPWRGPIVTNSSRRAKTYHVKIERPRTATSLSLLCLPLVDAPRRSGVLDKAACKVGAPCLKSAPASDESATCGANPNLGDDVVEGGFCY